MVLVLGFRGQGLCVSLGEGGIPLGPVSLDVVWWVSLLSLPVYGILVLLLSYGKDAMVERAWQSKPLSSYATVPLLER